MERTTKPISGYIVLLVILALIALIIYGITIKNPIIIVPTFFVTVICATGFMAISPNGSRVLTLFGAYKGTVRDNGFFWANPFYKKQKISLRARNLDTPPIKVNDSLGNPIKIGAVVVWKVKETFRAAFDVDDYQSFVNIQSEAAIRKLAGHYPYDDFEDEHTGEVNHLTLRSGGVEIDEKLEDALTKRLDIAGIEVIEARISYLAYSEEIASAMLQRQQATAIIAARKKIVEGAVLMVDDALKQLSENNIVELDDDKKAAMVSNLLVVLCSDKAASPIVNAGTLHN
ncbi:MAG: SPFH domain-containing protein [Bacteroidia bacterium]|nr:SPFH domain-containing protein [Bacteroidia bacterium]NNJ56115.1 SPFH domain-containing protein [Bacteroidia bacterium]